MFIIIFNNKKYYINNILTKNDKPRSVGAKPRTDRHKQIFDLLRPMAVRRFGYYITIYSLPYW